MGQCFSPLSPLCLLLSWHGQQWVKTLVKGLLGDLLFLLLGIDSKVNAGSVRAGLSLSNHLWNLDDFHPLEHSMTTIKEIWKSMWHPSERRHRLKLAPSWLQSLVQILALLLRVVWSWMSYLKSPSFHFYIYKVPPLLCCEIKWDYVSSPFAPTYLVKLSLELLL